MPRCSGTKDKTWTRRGEISAAVIAIHRTAYGQHLSSVETVVGEGCVACVLRFDVTRAEHAVIQAGDGGAWAGSTTRRS